VIFMMRPTLRERRHRGLARRLVAVRRRAVLVVPKIQRPHPRRTYRRGGGLYDAADYDVVGKHVVVIVPLAGRAARRCAPEDQRGHVPIYSPTD
jgi:hypothetical protein